MERKSASPVRPIFELLISALVLLYAWMFARWNTDHVVTMRFWGSSETLTAKVFFPLLAAFVAGFLIAWVFASLGALSRLLELRRIRKRLRGLQEEISRLRNVP